MAKILIIDDEAALRTTMRATLEQDGHEVFEAKHGGDGLELVRTVPIDLVVTDIMMPETDGIETIIAMRRAYPNIRIMAISGGSAIGGTHYLTMAEKFGASQVLAKPFRRQQLLDAVNASLHPSAEG